MSRTRPKPLSPMESAFEEHLKQAGIGRDSVAQYISCTRRFLKFVGADTRLDRISPETVKAFFNGIGESKKNRNMYSMVLARFLRLAAERDAALPAVRGSRQAPPPALRRKWTADRMKEQKEAGEDLIAKLARKVIDHHLFFRSRLEGGPESVDELQRLAAESQELIQTHLTLFLSLSHSGRNIHPLIDERVK